MSNDGVWSSWVKPPIWKSENAAGFSVSHSASEAAIFIGWASVTATPNSLPTPSWTNETGRTTMIASFAAPAEGCDVPAAAQVPAGHAEHQEAAGEQPGHDRVGPGEEHEPLGEDVEDVVCLRAIRLRADLVADRVLHPGVRREDEVRREPGTEPDEVDGREVNLRREPVPAEDPQPDEGRLEHERPEALDRERRAEDVPDVAREAGPVHAELKLHHEAGGDADREVDQEESPEEARHAQPLLVARPVPERLHHRQERRQPERQRDEREVVERRQRELPAGKLERCRGDRHATVPIRSSP